MTEPAAEGPTDPAPGALAAPVDQASLDPAPVEQEPVDPHESEPPRSLLARIRLFFYRTTLGRTRRDKSDV